MPYSAHRPGRFDSQGRIILDSDPNADTDDLDFLRAYEPSGADLSEPQADPTPESEPEPEQDAAASARPVREPKPRRQPRERTPRVPGSRLRKLAILGGAEGEILDRVPGETPRFVQMFFVLAGTALVSAISMLFALTTGVQAAIWLAVPLAIVWALIIFNLDRFLTSTMSSTRNVWRLIGLAIPRVIMAAIIGFVVAEPLVLQIFHNDIAREVASTNITQAQADQDALETGPERKALDAASDRVAELENQAATGIVAGTDSSSASESAAQTTVDDLTAKMTAQQGVIDQARVLYQCELTGEGAGTVPGCTGVNGEGASSDAAQAQLAEAQQTYDALAAQLRTANEELAAAGTAAKENTSTSETQNREEAQSQLPAARDSYDTALAAYNARAESVASGNAGAIGLLSQISGLNRLSEKEPTILWAHILIAALFFMIELLPVLVKVLTSYGDPSLYEKAAAIRKQVALDKVTAEGFRDRAAIVNVQSQGIQSDAAPTEPQTRAERKEAEQAAQERAQAEERELADKRAQAQTLEEQEQLVEPRV
ncbi:DUF4407 domain-containing protein [Microbacterium phyllosphaerae]|uniref:DUF4407 domain-containing protein n=1 Tax=Microbacterium phyllosphaerae TaxID=124798 RepID=UPI000EA2F74C|nr:DUF4407 domain-containing protein [Microbacterium phyllosphaerae]